MSRRKADPAFSRIPVDLAANLPQPSAIPNADGIPENGRRWHVRRHRDTTHYEHHVNVWLTAHRHNRVPDAAWPYIQALGRSVAIGRMDLEEAAVLIRTMPQFAAAFGRIYWHTGTWIPSVAIEGHLRRLLAHVVDRDTEEMLAAALEVERAIAPVLAKGESPDAVAEALNRGRLTPAQLAEILEHEKAWWIRAHAKLEAEAV